MKILFLSRYQNQVDRGAESFTKELSIRLSKKHQVIIFSGHDADSFKNIILAKADIVIAMNGRGQALKASLARLFSPHKLVISGQAGMGKDDIWNIIVCCPNLYVALTEPMFKWAKKWSWFSKIIKIPNGVDLKRFSVKGEKTNFKDLQRPIILSVGALEWYKYHERTIQAVARLEQGSLVIVGSGSKIDKLQTMGSKLLSGRFKIIKIPYEKMPKVYRSADVFTLPSWEREAFGIVYIEAMASNVPVVAPNDKSRQEIMSGAGILVDTSNIDSYAQALDKALSENWGNKPRQQASKFDWDIVSQKYEKALMELK